ELEPRFRKSGQQQLLVETLLVRFALLDRAVEIEDLLRSMGGASSPAPRDTPARAAAPSVGSPGGSSRPEPRPVPRADAPPGPRAEAPARPMAQAAPAAAVAPALAKPAGDPLELNRVVERWDALVERMRESGKPMLATALVHASPASITAAGVVT